MVKLVPPGTQALYIVTPFGAAAVPRHYKLPVPNIPGVTPDPTGHLPLPPP